MGLYTLPKGLSPDFADPKAKPRGPVLRDEGINLEHIFLFRPDGRYRDLSSNVELTDPQSMSFTGNALICSLTTNQRLAAPHQVLTDKFTLVARLMLRSNGIGSGQGVFAKDNGGSTFATLLWETAASQMKFRIRNTSNVSVDAVITDTLPLKEFVTIVCTYDGANVRIFKDGILEDTAAQTGNIDSIPDDFMIGAYDTPGVSPLHGEIEMIAFDTKQALSPAQARAVSLEPYRTLLKPANAPLYFIPGAAAPANQYSPIIDRYYRTLLSGH